MTVESFLVAPCEPWRDDPDDDPRPDEPTWGDWLKDILVTLEREREGFDGKRPNCCTNWQYLLPAALCEHGVTMAEVVAHVFDADGKKRRLHEPGYRTREALEGFREWAGGDGESPAAARFAGLALGRGRQAARYAEEEIADVSDALARFSLKEETWPAPPGPRFDCNWPVRLRRYLDEVMLDAWKRTDIWRPRSS